MVGGSNPLTFRAEARAGCEAGHIYDLDSKLLARVPVDAAPHHTEGAPAKREGERSLISSFFKPIVWDEEAQQLQEVQRASGTDENCSCYICSAPERCS